MDSKNLEYEFINVKKQPIEKNQLKNISKKIGMDQLFNMKGPTFRKMKLDYSTLTEGKKLDLLFENQNMIKRPLLEYNNKYLVGFNEETILKFLNK